jgi:hypothetical protein
MSNRLQRGRPVLFALLHLALMPTSAEAATILTGEASATTKDARSRSLWEVTKDKSPSILGSPEKVDLFSTTFPGGYDGFDLSGVLGDDPLGIDKDTLNNPIFSDFMKPGAGHPNAGTEATVEKDLNSEKSAKLENALFDNFGREIGMYYGCRSDKDVDWYLKRTFERLKNTIVQYPDLTSITLSEAQIAEKIQANLGKPLNSTSEKYVQQLAEYSKRLSNGLVKRRTEPGIDWSEPLGGGKGVLQDAGLITEAGEWNKVGSGAIFSAPKTDIRGEGICSVKSTAKDRDAANHVMAKKITYDVSKAEPHDAEKAVKEEAVDKKEDSPTDKSEPEKIDAAEDPSLNKDAEKIAAATAEPESSVVIDKAGKSDGTLVKGDLPAANKDNIKDTTGVLSTMKELASKAADEVAKQKILAGVSEVQTKLGEMMKQQKSHNRQAREDGHAAFLKYGSELRKQFTDMPKDRPGIKSVYKAIWAACLERKDLLATSFARKPRAWRNAFDDGLKADETCKEACRLSGATGCP